MPIQQRWKRAGATGQARRRSAGAAGNPPGHSGGYWLNRLRNEGGRIVITELPPLPAPQDYAPAVDEVVRAVLGPDALR